MIRAQSRAAPQPVVLVLASGRGERFAASGGGTHKLQALLAGKSVLEHTLAAVRSSGLPWHLEDAGHPGMGDTIAAAVRTTADAPGWLVLPGDLPLIQAATLGTLAELLADHPVVVPVYLGQRGHPVGFARGCRDGLLACTGDQGASGVVKAWGATEIEVDDPGCVADIDTVEDLERARVLLQERGVGRGQSGRG